MSHGRITQSVRSRNRSLYYLPISTPHEYQAPETNPHRLKLQGLVDVV